MEQEEFIPKLGETTIVAVIDLGMHFFPVVWQQKRLGEVGIKIIRVNWKSKLRIKIKTSSHQL